jgi:hypothetical protein
MEDVIAPLTHIGNNCVPLTLLQRVDPFSKTARAETFWRRTDGSITEGNDLHGELQVAPRGRPAGCMGLSNAALTACALHLLGSPEQPLQCWPISRSVSGVAQNARETSGCLVPEFRDLGPTG